MSHSLFVAAGQTVKLCTCFMSEKMPYCDGAHKQLNTGIKPLLYTANKDEQIILCSCSNTYNPPFCDGSHVQKK